MTSNSPNIAVLQGQDVYDREGSKVGTVGQIFADRAGQPTWASVNTGLLGMHHTLVPLNGASTRDDGLQIAFDKATVKAAPNVDYAADQPLTSDQVQELYQHYQLQSDPAGTADHDHGYTAGAEQTRDAYDTSTAAYDTSTAQGGYERTSSESGYERTTAPENYQSDEQTRVDRDAPGDEERHRLV